MGLVKSEIFSDQQNEIASLAKAFGHPARVAILQHLFSINACVCGELVEEIGLAQATTAQHLKELKSMGMIKGSIEGASMCYCIDKENWSKMKSLVSDFLNQDLKVSDCY